MLRDGAQRSPLPLVNDMYFSDFMAMDKSEDNFGQLFKVLLRIEHPEQLMKIDRMALKLGTYFKTVWISSAELTQPSSSCHFILNSEIEVPDGGLIELHSERCAWQSHKEFILTIRGKSIEGLAVLGHGRLSETEDNPQIYAVDRSGKTLTIAGSYLPQQTKELGYWPRLRLLAYMWNWNHDWAFFGLLLLAGMVAISGSLAYFLGSVWQRKPLHSVKTIILGSFLIAGLQVCFAMISPPFQAPDEPDHFLTFSRMGGLLRAEQTGLSLANHAHFDRLMAHAGEKFTKNDLDRPMVQTSWNSLHINYVDVPSRSAYANALWPLIARLFFDSNSSPENVLLGLRMFNGLYFTLIFLLSLLIFRKSDQFGIMDCLAPLLLVPALFHFSNHSSNHAFIIGHYLPLLLIFRSLVTGLLLTGLSHFWIGLTLALCFLSGRLGLIYLMVAYGCYFIRWVWLGSKAQTLDSGLWMRLLKEFGSVLSPLIVLITFSWTSPYMASIQFLQSGQMGVLTLVMMTLLLLGWALGLWAGYFFQKMMHYRHVLRAFKLIGYMVVAILIFLLFFPLIHAVPPLMNIEYLDPRLPAWTYSLKVIKHYLLSWGWGGKDFYLVESFWGGFGWLEPVVGDTLVQLLKGSMATTLCVGFFRSLSANDFRHSLSILLCLFVLLSYLLMLAYGSALQLSNLHGRYMVGFYLLSIQVSFFSIKADQSRSLSNFWSVLSITLMVVAQIASVWYVMGRYF